MAASETKLGLLHEKVAEVLSDALDGDELPGWVEVLPESGEEIVHEAKRMAPSAAIIAAATKFLKDNNITATPANNSAVNELVEKFKAKQKANVASRADMAAAKEQMGFLTGLPN